MPLEPIDIVPIYAFWREGVGTAARNAKALLQMAGEPVTFTNLARIVRTAPMKESTLMLPSWQAGYCNQCLKTAFNRHGEKVRPLMNYFLDFLLHRSREAQCMLVDTFDGIYTGMED